MSVFIEDCRDDDVEHYGVLGMKWGVRKNPERAAQKANKKLTKLDRQVRVAEGGIEKVAQKSLRKRQKADSAILFKKRKARKAAASIDALNRAHVNVQRKAMKAKKWYDSMEQVLGKKAVNALNKENGNIGKKYVDMTIDSLMKNVGTDLDMRQLSSYYQNKGRRR